MDGQLTLSTGSLEVKAGSVSASSGAVRGLIFVAGLVQAAASGLTLIVPACTVYKIIAGAASADFNLSLPASPIDGQLLWVRNDSGFSAVTTVATLATGSGGLFVGVSGAWVQMM